MNTNEIFEYICQATDEIGEELVNISRYMFENPEIGFKEVLAADRLSQFIESFGFSTCRGSGQLSTAVKGSKPRVNGINIGFLSETDALPIGHACGHNLIAASGVGAAIVFDKAIDKFQLNANSVWFATPAEEGGGGKAYMVKDGWFDAIDYAMMIHPCDRTMVGDYTLACQMLDIKYHGVSAHSTGSPWKGCNALAAMTQTISMIDAWRFQFKQTSRLTGYIVNGGKAVNVIPDLTELKYLARAETTEELMNVVDIVCRCAECAANYFDRDKVKLTSLTWRIILEGSARTIALETGEVDMVLNMDAIDAEKIEENPDLKLYSMPANNIEYMALNMKEGSVFEDIKVRQAINYAIDREGILLISCEGRGVVARSELLTGLPGYCEDDYEYNPERAKELLKEAGYDESNPLTFVIKTSGAAREREAVAIQGYLSDIGVECTVETAEWATFLDETMKGDFDAYIMGINYNVGDTDFLVDGFFHSRQIGVSSNRFAFRNDRVDELATLGQTCVDAAQREEYYTEAVQIIVDSYPWVPLYIKDFLTGAQADLQGYEQHPLFMEDYYLLHY